MNTEKLEHNLINITIQQSNFDETRNYISLSNIAQDNDTLIKQYREGYTADDKGRLKCYKGYQMETDMLKRLKQVLDKEQCKFILKYEVTAKNNLFKGHPDLVIEFGDRIIPCDCKSLLMDEWLPDDYKAVSRKIKYQMNAYMLLTGAKESWLIYESRESGLIKVIQLYPDKRIQQDITTRLDVIAKLIQN